jgi:hypothetical protein
MTDKDTGLDTGKLKRKKAENGVREMEAVKDVPVSAGPVDKVIELAFNPSRDKIREVTVIDRLQGRLFPLLDMVNAGFQYVLEIAQFRQDKDMFAAIYKRDEPVSPNFLDEYMYRTAQWSKSIAGKNLERATDIALAETEAKSSEGEDIFGGSDKYIEQ